MTIELTGGCTVSGLREGVPAAQGGVRVWQHAGRAQGAVAISLRVLELPAGRTEVGGAACDEVLYVLDGSGSVDRRSLDPDTGIYLGPNVRPTIDCAGPMTLVSSRCPDPDGSSAAATVPAASGGQAASAGAAVAPVVVRLSDCIAETTGDRWYRVLLDHHIGNSRVTQFVGDSARPRAGPLPRVRRGALHPRRPRPDVGRRQIHAHRARLLRVSAPAAGALRGEYGRRRTAPVGRLPSLGQPRRAVRSALTRSRSVRMFYQ